MIRAFQNLSLKTRVAVFTLGMLLLAIGTITWQFSTHLRQELEGKLSRQHYAEVSAVAERIDNAVQLRIDTLALTAQAITPQMLAQRERVSAFLSGRKVIYKLYPLGIFVISANGKVIADHPRTADRAKADHSGADFFRQVMATGEPAISRPGSGHLANEPSVVIAVPIFGQNDRIVGVLAGAVSLTDGSLLKALDTSTAPPRPTAICSPPRATRRESHRHRYLTGNTWNWL